MFVAVTMLLVAILCGLAVVRELRRKNLFAVGFAAISMAVFGWFSIATIVTYISSGGTQGIPM
ncbi:DUF2759 domain-containing protein [Halalkalibacterium halodurans]|jgi:hypothetical protein|uniref:Alkaliphily related protein n=2 Tax=Halalkalibacterium halodurans TaxID=86665 RepID=Q9K931_HALH5|nr:DUF2759 domain-containing protein [Halalkalibacterium halodurans]MDY7223372.1 DUF2759 domain-containing protein [Halalkalibacterium halodurans]MDY7242593.1 DUF2759 domain-containing protein [Halalkalibacterium halodurans]MED3647283.1 DUF2759 domain-containing protein [Halalkalibacterium halodurans]MED4081700.1 DUF2759 domain-containing protein [Halalkalibacterium halodurans]MED4085253.1 DUF2759 domain-containing protein [Halalkalibacterium halodurans]